jgi:hypothetical protein
MKINFLNRTKTSKGVLMSKTMRLKLNAPLRGLPAGTIKTIQADKNGIPLDPYWRRRLIDSKIDGCVEIVKETKKAKKVTAITKKKGE